MTDDELLAEYEAAQSELREIIERMLDGPVPELPDYSDDIDCGCDEDCGYNECPCRCW